MPKPDKKEYVGQFIVWDIGEATGNKLSSALKKCGVSRAALAEADDEHRGLGSGGNREAI